MQNEKDTLQRLTQDHMPGGQRVMNGRLIRALLAAALGDIGRHFPDTDARFKGADSMSLLVEAAALVRQAGWAIGNIDSTIIAQAPKLAPYIPAMQSGIAAALGLALEPAKTIGTHFNQDAIVWVGPDAVPQLILLR